LRTQRYQPGLAEAGLVFILFLPFLGWYLGDPLGYVMAMQEDTPVEWATFFLLIGAGIFAGWTAYRLRGSGDRRLWFFWAFAAGAVLAGLEEISFGQRIFGLESPDFFLEHSDQLEINAHNVFQKATGLMTRHLTGAALLLYGVALPLASRLDRFACWMEKLGVAVPPLALAPSFALGSILMLDWPTGEEEELGEMLHAACLVILAAGWWRTTRKRNR